MADPSSEDEGLLREWAPLTNLLQQIPLKAQRGIFTHELNLTCVDALSDFIALGTNLGLVYWYSRRKGDLQRLRCENTASAITCVKVISTVDYMLAVGNEQGMVTVFQIPKEPPDSLPESMRPVRKKQVERYTINGLHTSSVTAIEWSLNGMKLFSGDKNGLVVLTEIDFYMHLSKSVELLNEKYEIVQLSYCQQLLLVSTTYRSIVCHRDDRWRVAQVGQKERKSLGKLGATFCLGSGRPQDLTVYASRPGLRLWLADKNGIVQQTLIYKDTMMQEHRHVPLINPIPAHMKNARGDHTFGPLRVFKDNLLVTYSQDTVYVLNPTDIYVVATVADLRHVQDVSVTKDEIFILEGDRSIIRVAYLPEAVLEPGHDAVQNVVHERQCGQLSLNEVFLYIVGCPDIQEKLADTSAEESVWTYVSSEMSRFGYPMGEQAPKKCQQKWNHMVSCYNAFQKTKKWNDEPECPSFFEMLDQILKPNLQIDEKNAIEVISVAANNESTVAEPQSKKLKLQQVYNADSLSSSGSQCSEENGLLETSEVVDESNSVYIDSVSDCEGVYYDKHITVYPETSNSELTEEVVLSDVVVDGGNSQNVYVVVTPSFFDHSVFLKDSGGQSEEEEEEEEEEVANEIKYTYLPVVEGSNSDETIQFEVEEGEEDEGEENLAEAGNAESNRSNISLRPVPTPAQALMALVTRIGREERERDNLRRIHMERSFEALESAIWKQNSKINELTDRATALLTDLLQEDSSDSE
ncbi:hypothetical protein R5R35_011714 [Gryllus longicercus]|uniref:Uncharacterized protein n=1 Tax=Gryllus longicercus TaxID=2509291 RepID=A0AAN9V469_9ORTH